MMSLKSKRELLEVLRPRYLKVNKVEKQKMLDEFTSATNTFFCGSRMSNSFT